MSFQLPAINYFYLVACIMAVSLALFSRGRAVSVTGRLWICVLLSFAVWTAGEFIANLGTTLAWQLAWQRMVYLGVIGGVTSWLFFALHYSGNAQWVARQSLPLFFVVPVASLLMIATLELHPLLYREAELVLRDGNFVLQTEYGIGFWLLSVSCGYLYALTGSALLLKASVDRPGIHRSQSVLIAVAALLPFVPNVLYVSGVNLAGGFDPTSLYFVLSAILITVATQRYHFLSLTPVARDRVFETIPIAVAVCNRELRITDVNFAFADMTGIVVNELPGQLLDKVLSECFKGEALDSDSGQWQGRLEVKNSGRLFDVRSETIAGDNGDVIGYLVTFNDVTDMQEALDMIGQIANTDILTTLPNRRGLAKWSVGNDDKDQDLAVIGDIDHFKVLNETHGHEFGDRVLMEVASLMRESLRPSDQIARWGGEEFCIVLKGANLATGREAIERLRKRIENHDVIYNGISANVTMSFGVVAMHQGEELEESIRRADVLLYKCKQSGRNRVCAE